jgi:hypothetical protein
VRRAKAQAGAAWAAAGLPGRVVSTSQSESGSNYTSTGSCGDGEGGGPWRRGGAAATGRAADHGGEGWRRRQGEAAMGRAADLGGEGERRRRGGRRTLAATGRRRRGGRRTLAATGGGGDGEGDGPWWRGAAAATGRAADLGCDGARRRRGGRRRLKGGEVTAGQNNALSARWHECAGTSARVRTAHGEGSELGRRGPANLGEAGGGGTLAARMEQRTLVARCDGEVGRRRQPRRRGRSKPW